MATSREYIKKNAFLSNIGRSVFIGIAKLLTLLSPRLNTNFIYYIRFGRFPNLSTPQTLNEKVMCLKLNVYNKDVVVRQCADKFAVRRYLKDHGLEHILVPLLASYDNPTEIKWDSLPNSFFVKWNFGCGLNIRCKNLNTFDRDEAVKKLRKWKSNTDYLTTSELQYECKEKKIIIEEDISLSVDKLPEDYKVYCFNGKPLFVLLCVDRHLGHAKFLMVDKDFNYCPAYTYDGLNTPVLSEKKPSGFDEILKYAKQLSEPFDFVRVDFYIINGKVYFGELTFTSSGGRDLDITPEFDRLGGDLVTLTSF